MITVENKGCLVHELIFKELIRRRRDQLDSFCKGLQVLGLLSVLKMHRKVANHILCYKLLEISADQFISFLKSNPSSHAERQAYQWFLDYVASADGVRDEDFPKGKLNTLLKFTTGLWNIPPVKSKLIISVKFLEDDDEEKLPKSGSCSCILHLPTVHSSLNTFNDNINIALKYGHAGFTEY